MEAHMSDLLKTIKADFLAARKARDPNAAFLSALVGDIESAAIGAKERVEVTDEHVISVVKSYLKKNDELLRIENLSENMVALAQHEKSIVEKYLPKQLTIEELHGIIRSLGQTNLGLIMKHLKENYSGQYDGKVASLVAREFV
jgi:uncharacterized protein YqeY